MAGVLASIAARAAFAAILLFAPTLRAQVSSIESAAILVFPYVVADSDRDAVIEIANIGSISVPMRCFYDDETPRCRVNGPGGEVCLRSSNADDCTRCSPAPRLHDFFVRLTPRQPLSWQVSVGRSDFPLESGFDRPPRESNDGSFIPPVALPFVGALRCVALDESGNPGTANALIGTATIRVTQGESIRQASYNAAGIRAVTGDRDRNDLLMLGGDAPEYQGCPQRLAVSFVADGATVRPGDDEGAQVLSTVAVTPCVQQLDEYTLQFTTFNEFGQRFSTASRFEGQFVSMFHRIDRAILARSIFGAAVQGTLTLQADVRGFGDEGSAGLVGVVIEEHTNAIGERSIAAVNLDASALQLQREVFSLELPSCIGDCDGDGFVTVDEVMLGVNIALGLSAPSVCSRLDLDRGQSVTVDEVIAATTMALEGCVFAPPPLPTRPPQPPATPAPTPSGGAGPDIVVLAVARFDGTMLEPDAIEEGRPVYERPSGQGFLIVAEARRGGSGRPPGRDVFDEAGGLPDLQLIVSNELGDGSEEVCDNGGVPATEPLEFGSAEEISHAVNDLGCRAFAHDRQRPCTRVPVSMEESMIADNAEVQYCLPIARAWRFPEGDTVVAARVRDNAGAAGPVSEMVVRVRQSGGD